MQLTLVIVTQFVFHGERIVRVLRLNMVALDMVNGLLHGVDLTCPVV